MIDLKLGLPLGRLPSILALGAHPDDIEIGCGGTLLTLARDYPGLRARVVLLTGPPLRAAEARASAAAFLADCEVEVKVHGLPDGRLPVHWGEVKELLEGLAESFTPDLIFAPRVGDAHQDHRVIAEIVPTVWRDHLVLGYEIPKYDGDLTAMSIYMPLDDETVQLKAELLRRYFSSQATRPWFDDQLFLGLARLRGVECRTAYAEAFTADKVVLRP